MGFIHVQAHYSTSYYERLIMDICLFFLFPPHPIPSNLLLRFSRVCLIWFSLIWICLDCDGTDRAVLRHSTKHGVEHRRGIGLYKVNGRGVFDGVTVHYRLAEALLWLWLVLELRLLELGEVYARTIACTSSPK